MAKDKNYTILRTVYLSRDLDDVLSQMKLWEQKERNDLICQFIKEGIKRWKKPKALKILEKNSKKKR